MAHFGGAESKVFGCVYSFCRALVAVIFLLLVCSVRAREFGTVTPPCKSLLIKQWEKFMKDGLQLHLITFVRTWRNRPDRRFRSGIRQEIIKTEWIPWHEPRHRQLRLRSFDNIMHNYRIGMGYRGTARWDNWIDSFKPLPRYEELITHQNTR